MGPEPDPTSTVPGMQIWGWMSPDELEWLGARAAEMDSVAEVGCLHGRSAYMLLTRCPGTVYCVDPWDDPADQSYPSFMGNCGVFPNLVAVRARSPLGDRTPTVDMTFIDGDHELDSVVADIRGWLPHTRHLICGHDYYPGPTAGFPGVARAVRQEFGEAGFAVAPGTSIWYVNVGRPA